MYVTIHRVIERQKIMIGRLHANYETISGAAQSEATKAAGVCSEMQPIFS